jgi:predicted O-methyltransferase YrrM
MNFINSEIEDYCLNFSSKETKLLQKLSRETYHKIMMPRMMSGHYMGLFLKLITSLKKPKKILEIGMFTGYSTICLANELTEEGELHTIEINEEVIDFSSKFIQESKLEKKIHIHKGDAKNIISKMNTKFDLVFIDADKKNYCLYYDLCISKLNPGGHILIDNVLWSGKVIKEVSKKDTETNEIMKLNKKITEDKRVENILLPIRDGLMICKLI